MNLVVLTEGTGQGVRGRKTNVSRLYDLLVEGKNQRINLEAGPGTRPFRHFGGTFFGSDALSIVNHHQNWFLNHAPRPKVERDVLGAPEPKIFLFGFSRGALIMRVFAEWLCQRGFPVEYMGLWDTVDSTVGIDGEDYVELPSNVKFARHAVARDEQRKFFGYLPLRVEKVEGVERVEELVFPGCHSDVGGLYDDNHAIADVTLDWILEPAVKRGLKIGLRQPTADSGQRRYVCHDSLSEPTNGWGMLDPVKRSFDGVKRHPLCDII